MRDRLARLGFVLSVAVLAYAVGFLSYHRRWPPAPTLIDAYLTAEDLALHWQNDLGLEPTRLLVPAADASRPTVHVADPAALAPGHRFVAGLMRGRPGRTGALLLDAEGRELHYWPIDFSKLVPDGSSPNNVFMHGTLPLKDGSVVANFDNGDVAMRLDPCGEPIWLTRGRFHHSISLAEDGTLWLWEDRATPEDELNRVYREHIVQLDADTGERLRLISLDDEVLGRQGLYGEFAIHSEENQHRVLLCCDPFHPNNVKPLPSSLAPAFPMFRAGDLLISLRSLNMVAVLDGETTAVKWSRIGPWHRQHDPDFLPDGTISVLDNRMGLGSSAVVIVDPATGNARVVFDGAKHGNFSTWRRGTHQWLDNGNLMLAETEKGRAIEVDPEGAIVWSYDNVFDAERNGLVNEAMVLPADYFDGGLPSCKSN